MLSEESGKVGSSNKEGSSQTSSKTILHEHSNLITPSHPPRRIKAGSMSPLTVQRSLVSNRASAIAFEVCRKYGYDPNTTVSEATKQMAGFDDVPPRSTHIKTEGGRVCGLVQEEKFAPKEGLEIVNGKMPSPLSSQGLKRSPLFTSRHLECTKKNSSNGIIPTSPPISSGGMNTMRVLSKVSSIISRSKPVHTRKSQSSKTKSAPTQLTLCCPKESLTKGLHDNTQKCNWEQASNILNLLNSKRTLEWNHRKINHSEHFLSSEEICLKKEQLVLSLKNNKIKQQSLEQATTATLYTSIFSSGPGTSHRPYHTTKVSPTEWKGLPEVHLRSIVAGLCARQPDGVISKLARFAVSSSAARDGEASSHTSARSVLEKRLRACTADCDWAQCASIISDLKQFNEGENHAVRKSFRDKAASWKLRQEEDKLLEELHRTMKMLPVTCKDKDSAATSETRHRKSQMPAADSVVDWENIDAFQMNQLLDDMLPTYSELFEEMINSS